MRLARGLVAWLSIASSTACSTTATVHQRDGYMLEGRIRGGTGGTIIVDPRIGRSQEIARRDIVEIDHPGNVHALIGGIVFGVGGLAAAGNCGNTNSAYDRSTDCFYSVSMAVSGAALLGWGLYTWFRSSDAAGDTSLEHLPREHRGPRRELPPPREEPEGDEPERDEPLPGGDKLPPAPPPPPGAVPSPPAPSSSVPPAPPPPPGTQPPPAETPPGGVVW